MAGFLEIGVAVIHRDCQGIRRQAAAFVQPVCDGGHGDGMIVAADVRALAGQGGAIGEAMIHQNAEALAVEPAGSRESAGVMEGGCRGGFQGIRH